MNIYGLLLFMVYYYIYWSFIIHKDFFKSNKSYEILSTKEHNVDS